MQADKLTKDSVIGIFCPSHVGSMDRYGAIKDKMERMGYRVKLSQNFLKDTYGYAASAEERAADLNALIADDEVHMILFSGGEGAVEILPLIDYENIRRHPKLLSSYSDATSILNAIHAQTGLITYYGWGAGQFLDMRHYDYAHFTAHFHEKHGPGLFVRDSQWHTLHGGRCEGRLIGGYLSLFALMLSNRFFSYDAEQPYLLFLEDHEQYSNPGAVSTYLSFIEQSPFMPNVKGLVFGHYSDHPSEDFMGCLRRFGAKNGIPVVYTDDFGHGVRHAILPIGACARLDADQQGLTFL